MPQQQQGSSSSPEPAPPALSIELAACSLSYCCAAAAVHASRLQVTGRYISFSAVYLRAQKTAAGGAAALQLCSSVDQGRGTAPRCDAMVACSKLNLCCTKFGPSYDQIVTFVATSLRCLAQNRACTLLRQGIAGPGRRQQVDQEGTSIADSLLQAPAGLEESRRWDTRVLFTSSTLKLCVCVL